MKVIFGSAGELTPNLAQPLLRDTGKKLVRFRMPSNVTRADVEKALGSAPSNDGPIAGLNVELPGATLKAAKAQIRWQGNDLIIMLLQT